MEPATRGRAMALSGVRGVSAVEFQRPQQSPLADGTGYHASAFGSWSGRAFHQSCLSHGTK